MADDKRAPRSTPALNNEDRDFAAAVAAAHSEIQVASSWGTQIEDEIATLAELHIELADARIKGSGIFEAAKKFRGQEARVNEMMQRRLASEVTRIRRA